MFTKDSSFINLITGYLKEIDIFKGLTEDQLLLLEPVIETQTFEKGSTIFRENDKSDSLFIVKKGKVSMRFSLKVNTGTIRPIVQTVYEKGILGELEFIDSHPRAATAIAEEDSILIKIERMAFYTVLGDNPDIAYIVTGNFNKVLTSRLRRSDRQMKIALQMGWNAYKFDKY